MKILSKEQILMAEKFTFDSLKISPLNLMEKVGGKAFEIISNSYLQYFDKENDTIHVFCGNGNNGGDGLVIARLFTSHNYKVKVYLVNYQSKSSENFLSNVERFKTVGLIPITIDSHSIFPEIKKSDLLIDAIFGIGLNRSPEGLALKIIKNINNADVLKISIDLPSGLFVDQIPEDLSAVVKANLTLSIQFPKLVFYLPNTSPYVGKVEILDVGLLVPDNQKFSYLTTQEEVQKIYRPIKKSTHKGQQGHSLLIGGSYGKIGAMVLASKASLKVGSGLATAYLPECGYQILQTAVPEAMTISDQGLKFIEDIKFDLKPSAIGIGMGLGQAELTDKTFRNFIKTCQMPLLIDADGINILASNKELLNFLPPETILTPHPKELERLIGPWQDDCHKIELTQKIAKTYGLIILIKGPNTLIITGDTIFVNTTGNAGLATAGSGDLLSGMIVGLLAQGYPAIEATKLGVYLHGLSGDLLLASESMETINASDLFQTMGKAFKSLVTIQPCFS